MRNMKAYSTEEEDIMQKGSIFSAGLGQRNRRTSRLCFGTICWRNLEAFANQFSLLVIDECHRVPDKSEK